MNEVDKLNRALAKYNRWHMRLSKGIIVVSIIAIIISAVKIIHNVSN